jgi:hypothetical protein
MRFSFYPSLSCPILFFVAWYSDYHLDGKRGQPDNVVGCRNENNTCLVECVWDVTARRIFQITFAGLFDYEVRGEFTNADGGVIRSE